MYSFIDQKSRWKRKLPVYLLWFLASVTIWALIFYSFFLFYMYVPLYLDIYKDADLKVPCPEKLSKWKYSRAMEKINLQRINKYYIGDIGPYLKRFGADESTIEVGLPSELTNLPYIVTAVDESQFYYIQGLIRHVHEDLSTVKGLYLIIYDVGLNVRQRELVLNFCDCIFRDFRSEFYPDHVSDLTNYAWRPLIIQEVLEETGSVIFVEPTTRFKSVSIFNLFLKRGTKSFFLWDTVEFTSVVAYTHPGMFQYLEEKRCSFLEMGMVSTDIMVFYRTNTTWFGVMKPWLKCALNEKCIAPRSARKNYCLNIRHPLTTGCHWFDQSALSIITNRAFQLTTQRERHILQRLVYSDPTEQKFFNVQPRTNTQIICIILLPFLVYVIFRARKCFYHLSFCCTYNILFI